MKNFFARATFQVIVCTIALAFIQIPVFGQAFYDLMQQEPVKLSEVQKSAEAHFNRFGKGKGSGYKLFKRWEYNAIQKLQEDGYVMSDVESAKRLEQAFNATLKNGDKDVAQWTELGPLSWEVTSGYAPGTGRITALAVEPSQQQLIFAGSPGGGLWKSTNGGSSWIPLGDEFSNMDIWALAIDPQSNQHILMGNGAGLYESNDGGQTFTTLPLSSSGGKITNILFHPTNSNIIHVAIRYVGLFRTTNGGNSWIQVVNSGIEDVAYKPGSSMTLYACGNDFYRSTDGGLNFNKITQGIVTSRRMKLAVTPADSNYVYVVQDERVNGTNQFGYLYKSVDAGSSFTVEIDTSNGTDFIGRQSSRDMAIAVSDNDSLEIHIGGLHMFKSGDGGKSFNQECHWVYGQTNLANPPGPYAYVHADIEIIQYINGNIFVGSDGGVFKSTNNGNSFVDLTKGMGIHQLYRIGNSASNKDLMASGAQDNGLNMMVGSQHKWRHWYGADGMECWIHPQDDSIQYASVQFGSLIKTTDGGFSRYRPVKPPQHGKGNWLTPMAVDPNNGNRIYVGYDTLYRHENGGDVLNWISASPTFNFGAKLSVIELCPTDSNIVYVGAASKVYKCDSIFNTNPTWNHLSAVIGGNVNDIAVNPLDHKMVAVGTSVGFVYLTTDGGQTWNRIDSGLPVLPIKSLVFDKSGKTGIYVAVDGAVYYKNDDLNSWNLFSNNLPNVETRELEIFYGQQGESRVRVATYGRGVWESPLYQDIISGVAHVNNNHNELLLYPNPTASMLNIEFRSEGKQASVQVSDLSGRIVKSVSFDTHNGLTLYKLPTNELGSGTYILRLKHSSNIVTSKKFQVHR